MKRLMDVALSLVGLLGAGVILPPAIIAIWLEDRHFPFYIAPRAGLGGALFWMVKLRSMKVGADASGVMSTAGDDPRISAVGRFVRRWKLDEIPQLWNVLKGEMSLVGPRPQVCREVERYTGEERRLLTVRPGMTDLASITFSDEAEILRGCPEPDQLYDLTIRPWKSRLGLLYVEYRGGVLLDLRIVLLTVRLIFDRPGALRRVAQLAEAMGADPDMAAIAGRATPLRPVRSPAGQLEAPDQDALQTQVPARPPVVPLQAGLPAEAPQ